MRNVRHLLIHIVWLAVCALLAAPAAAQVLPSLPNSSTSPGPSVPGLRQEGLFLTAPLTIDGVPVIRIATPLSGEETIAERILIVESAIAQILAQAPDGATEYTPKGFKVVVESEDNQRTLAVIDEHHTTPAPLVTVTSSDAQYARLPALAVAEQWRNALQPALIGALERRQPGHIRRSTSAVARSSTILAIVTVIVALALWFARKRKWTRGIAEVLLWLLGLAWIAHVIWALSLFPQTAVYANIALHASAQIVGIWITALCADIVIGLLISRFAHAYARRGRGPSRARHTLRAPTIARSLGGFKRLAVYFVAALATLSALNIPIASVVTIGGIVAVALGFAAQSLVRDFLNGLLVLFEDQYVVGDYVMINEYNGIVENLTLRIVQIRDGRGHLITIPHSAVTQVVNASRDWSRIDFRITVDADADLKKATTILRSTIEAMVSDPAWREAILGPPEWIGVETIGKTGIVLRASIRTAPMRQFDVRRALNERLIAAYAEAGIAFGTDPLGPTFVPHIGASPDPL
jgi:moderate conductance mechanosensitive channel